MRRFLSVVVFVIGGLILLPSCAATDQGQGQGSIDQNIRGGIFSSYTGQHGGGAAGMTNVTRTVTDANGLVTVEKIEITSNAPFVMMFDESQIQSDTDGSTTGASNDTADATTSTSTEADATIPLNGPR